MTTKQPSKKELRAVMRFSRRFRSSRMDPMEERESNNALLHALEPRLAEYEKLIRAPRDRFLRRGSKAA